MKLNQLSLFLENKPAHLKVPCQVLADAGINILTLALADTEQFGILRLVVQEWERAKDLLEQAGCVVNVTEVVAVEIEDRPGGLAELLELIDSSSINIEYMYAFTFGRDDRAVMIFRFEEPDAAIESLQSQGVNVVKSINLYERS
jgi:hypothetical protein